MRSILIFDFDGVIADTINLHLKLSQHFIPGTTIQDHIEQGKANPLLEPAIKYKKEDYQVYFDMYTKEICNEKMHPVGDFIKQACQQYKIIICSSSPKSGIEKFLKKNGIYEFIDGIYDVNLNPSKVEKFKIIMSRYKATPEECLFITDSCGDINEAKKVGIDSIGVTWGIHSKKLLEESKPYGIIEKIENLKYFIN